MVVDGGRGTPRYTCEAWPGHEPGGEELEELLRLPGKLPCGRDAVADRHEQRRPCCRLCELQVELPILCGAVDGSLHAKELRAALGGNNSGRMSGGCTRCAESHLIW